VIRVFLADDHAVVRDGLRRILHHTDDIQVVGEAGDGRAVLEWLRRGGDGGGACDVVVLDLNMPGLGGIDVLRQLRAQHPRLPILILSMYAEDQYAVRLLRAGASGYLAKGRSSDTVLDAIRRVASGHRYVTENVAERLLADRDLPDAPPHESLSQREHQVFTLLIEGKSPSDIANELHVSASTVSTYIARIKKQLGAQTIGEIIRYASRAGLL
jgi:DNA-binding NarL/FixJ family response regulator